MQLVCVSGAVTLAVPALAASLPGTLAPAPLCGGDADEDDDEGGETTLCGGDADEDDDEGGETTLCGGDADEDDDEGGETSLL